MQLVDQLKEAKMLHYKCECPNCGKVWEEKYPRESESKGLHQYCSECQTLTICGEAIEKPARKTRKFIPSPENCTVKIRSLGETEKAYQIAAGSNGLVGKGCRMFYEYIAKSICWRGDDGEIYAPSWVMKNIPFDIR